MDKEKVIKEIMKSIEAGFRALHTLTGATHISSFFLDGAVNVTDLTDTANKKFDYYSRGDENE